MQSARSSLGAPFVRLNMPHIISWFALPTFSVVANFGIFTVGNIEILGMNWSGEHAPDVNLDIVLFFMASIWTR